MQTDACGVRFDRMILTANELERAGDRAATALRRIGIVKGERVALHSANTPDLLACLIGLWRIGAVAVPLPLRHPSAVLRAALESAECRRLLFESHRPPAPELTTGIPSDEIPRYRLSDSQAEPFETWASDRPATLIFTSGSTGTPKAAQHRLSAHVASARGARANLPFAPGDCWLLSLPLYHVGGLSIMVRTLEARASLALPAPSQSTSEALIELRPTHASLVPTQLRRLLATPGVSHGLRGILLGGAAAPDSLVDAALAATLPIHTTYGLTEMASQVTTTPPDAPRSVLDTSGHVLPERELRLSETGEILVRGATRFDGYVTREGLSCPFDADGWYATGDVGALDSDGRLRVEGRIDFGFVSGGENVRPEAIERALAQVPGIVQNVVVPVADQEFGSRPVAFVDAPGWDLNDSRTLEALRERLDDSLARFQHPIALMPLPESSGMKPNRRLLIALAEAHRSQ